MRLITSFLTDPSPASLIWMRLVCCSYAPEALRARQKLRLNHPNVMPILDSDPDTSWFVMPLAAGDLEKLWLAGGTDGDPRFGRRP